MSEAINRRSLLRAAVALAGSGLTEPATIAGVRFSRA